MTRSKKYEGFTLIEILVVVGLIAILAAITFIAINPGKNFAETRNTTRQSDATAILNAVTQFTSEEGHQLSALGTIPLCTDTPAPIGTGGGSVDLAATLVDEYIVGIPIDPQSGTEANTGYTICQTTGGRVQIDAPGAENGKVISVKR